MTKKQRIFDSVLNFIFAFINLYIIFVIHNNNIKPNIVWIFILCYSVVALIFLIAQVSIFFNIESINKICIMLHIIVVILLFVLFLMQKYNFFEKFNSIEELQLFISKYGKSSALIFIAIQFLQVTILPLPSTITIITGVALFGVAKAIIYSCIGIILGSMFAFFLGRVFGVKLIIWISGENAFRKYQSLTSGKDRLLLFFMFLLPFFPDDLLCMIAGITNMTYKGFFGMQIVVRPIGVLFTAGAFKGVLSIPFAGWGIIFWVTLAILFVVLIVILWKYGDKIQSYFEIITQKIENKIKKVFRINSRKNTAKNTAKINRQKINVGNSSDNIKLDILNKNNTVDYKNSVSICDSNIEVDNCASCNDINKNDIIATASNLNKTNDDKTNIDKS